jgi:hypothetical protein
MPTVAPPHRAMTIAAISEGTKPATSPRPCPREFHPEPQRPRNKVRPPSRSHRAPGSQFRRSRRLEGRSQMGLRGLGRRPRYGCYPAKKPPTAIAAAIRPTVTAERSSSTPLILGGHPSPLAHETSRVRLRSGASWTTPHRVAESPGASGGPHSDGTQSGPPHRDQLIRAVHSSGTFRP